MAPESSTTNDSTLNSATTSWRQGDVVLDPAIISQILASPLDSEDTAGRQVVGVIVVSQTCDILKDRRSLPNVELCPIVKCADRNVIDEIRRRRSPRYAFIPSLAESLLAVDLSISLPLRKSILFTLDKVDGGFDHEEGGLNPFAFISRFQGSLARLRGRFAFPDNFNPFKKELGKALGKFKKSEELKPLLDAIDEIRAVPEISDEGNVVGAHLWFLLLSPPTLDEENLLKLNSRIEEVLTNVKTKLNEDTSGVSDIDFPVSYRCIEPSEMSVLQDRESHLIDFDDVS